MSYYVIETIGWISTILFLISILVPNRVHLHQLGIFAAVSTGIYAYSHGATAIWVKWLIAFFFHGYMLLKTKFALDPNPVKWLPFARRWALSRI